MRRSLTVALLPEEPAGRIATRSAGAARFEAQFAFRPGASICDALRGNAMPFGPPPPGTRLLPRGGSHAVDPTPGTRRYGCEIRAMSTDALRLAGERLLREASALAALQEAVFEARFLRFADPVVYSARTIEALARDLWAAGFPVSFGPSWSPIGDGSGAVGTGGLEAQIAELVRGLPFWHEASPVTARREAL